VNIQINLASQPFRRDRPVVAATAILSAILMALLGVQIYLAVNERHELRDVRRELDRLNREISRVAAQQVELEKVQRKPENAQVLDVSLFLNSLIYHKAISWTRIFADLEEVLPHNVRLISVRPYITGRNQVILEMLVGSEQTEPLLQLLMRLESSEQFGTTQLSSRMPPSQNDPLYRYKVNVRYAQKF
jgi:type IV pilus assembly protein PilN